MKNKDEKKGKQKRENSIYEAISPPFPQVQCISFAPETELQRGEGGTRRKRKEKSETRGGRYLRGKKSNKHKRNLF